jgi:drug/metabolite transporter (DMT)-like permease
MSAPALTDGGRISRRRRALWLLWLAFPLLGLGAQIASKLAAEALLDASWSWSLLGRVVTLPSVWAAALFELTGLGAWMVILSEIPLSAAFSISALSYVLVVAAGWTWFREPIAVLQVIGGAAILTGVWLIGRTPGEGEG